MPANVVNKMVDVLGMSQKEAEDLWDKAKAAAAEYKDFKKDSPRYFQITMSILKKMLGNEKTKKLGWESKTEMLLDIIKYYGTFRFYEILSEMQISFQADSNIAIKAAEKLDKAIMEKDVGFFKDLLQDCLTDLFMNHKTEEQVYAYVRDKLLKSLQGTGFGLTKEKIANIKEVLMTVVKQSNKEIKDFKSDK